MPLSDSNNQRKRELERLRLASDLTQLRRDTLNPNLRPHCVRTAKMWSDQSCQGPPKITSFKASCITDVMGGIVQQIPAVVLVMDDEPLLRMLIVEVVEEQASWR